MLKNLIKGFGTHIQAIKLITRNKEIRSAAIKPTIVTAALILIFVPSAIWVANKFQNDWLEYLGGHQDSYLTPILKYLFFAFVALIGGLIAFLIGIILSAPLNTRLSRITEKHITAQTPDEYGLATDIVNGIITSLGRLFIFILFYPIILLTAFIPVIGGIIYIVLSYFYFAFVLSFDLSEPTFERHIFGFKQKANYIIENASTYFGFGIGAMLLLFIPVLNIFIAPVCVVAATILFIKDNHITI